MPHTIFQGAAAILSRVINRLIASALARLPLAQRVQVARLVERDFERITYRRLAERGFAPGALIDIGAYRGDWTRMARAAFGNVPALMVEPQTALHANLERYCLGAHGVSARNSLLAAVAGQAVNFHEMGTGSSIFAEASNAPRTLTTKVTATLDAVAAEWLPAARDIFLKIDVQGAELEVLRGGLATLPRCALVQLEVAMLAYNAGAPLLPDVTAWMAERGWLPIEVSGFSRPRTELVQIDLLFAPPNSPLRPDYFAFS